MTKKSFTLLISSFLLMISWQFNIFASDLATKEKKMSNIIPRKTLFGNPDKIKVKISPDGKYISYVAPYQGVLNIYLAKTDDLDNPQIITRDKKRGITNYGWTFDNKHILYLQDNDGDENYHIFKVNLDDNKVTDLTPFKNSRAMLVEMDDKNSEQAVVAINNRDARYFDLYLLDINSNKLSLLYENKDEFSDFIVDNNYQLRFAGKPKKDGGVIYYQFNNGKYEQSFDISYEDRKSFSFIAFNNDNSKIFLQSSVGEDKASLYEFDIATKKQKLLFSNDKVDVDGIILQPKSKKLEAAIFDYDRLNYHFFDNNFKRKFEFLKTKMKGDLSIVSRSLDDQIWIVADSRSDYPVGYYLFDCRNNELKFLFWHKNDLTKYKLAPMQPVVIKTRDGLEMMSYLTLPNNSKDRNQNLPLILDVHGGPNVRDSWGLNSMHQWMANRGYAVLSVNYRGSLGFGKKFLNAGSGEWAGKMHDDLIDAVDWAIGKKIALSDKICIFGGSYGGYAALVGLTFTPDKFACAVDIVGPSNLATLLKSTPPYWASYYDTLVKTIGGDPNTEEGKAFLASRSPLTYVKNIKKPLLIAQGANDPRVKRQESDMIVEQMQKLNIPVTYALYPDEGHGFVRPENRLSFFALAEEFLNKHLGGHVENTEKEHGSSLKILAKG